MFRGRSPGAPHIFLAAAGSVLVAVAITGFLLNRNTVLVGSFLFLGVLLIIVSVFEPRMEGQQEFGPAGAKIKLAMPREVRADIKKAEVDLATGRATSIEDLTQ